MHGPPATPHKTLAHGIAVNKMFMMMDGPDAAEAAALKEELAKMVAEVRPGAIPAEFEDRTFERLVSTSTRRMAAITATFSRDTFAVLHDLNLSGFYPNVAELATLFEALAALGPAGPRELKYGGLFSRAWGRGLCFLVVFRWLSLARGFFKGLSYVRPVFGCAPLCCGRSAVHFLHSFV